jgi:hypothetical protein
MTPAEKAINAVNLRIERLQAALREAKSESGQRFLSESVIVTVGVGEALTDYIKSVGVYARRRHGELKTTSVALEAQHADLLKIGQAQLEQLKAKPADRAIRKEIDATQQGMAAIQKTLRREKNALQREVAPSLALIDELAESVRRFSEAERSDALKRALRAIVEQVRELYVAQRTLPANDTINAAAWEKSAGTEIDQATDFHDGYARAGYQMILALEVATLAVSETPPTAVNEATQRGNAAVAARIREIAGRFTAA